MPIGFDALLALAKLSQLIQGHMGKVEENWRESTKSEHFPQGLPNPVDAFGGGGIGSLARYRAPMRMEQLWARSEYPGSPLSTTYHFRNRLGERPFKASIDTTLDPIRKEAHIDYLRGEMVPGSRTERLEFNRGVRDRTPGLTPEQLKEVVGRWVEEVSGAGYPKVVSSPTSNSRFRLYERLMNKLKKEGKIPESEKLSYEQGKPWTDPYNEGPAMRRIAEERDRATEAARREEYSIRTQRQRQGLPVSEQYGHRSDELTRQEVRTPENYQRLSPAEELENRIYYGQHPEEGLGPVRSETGEPFSTNIYEQLSRQIRESTPPNARYDIYRLTREELEEFNRLNQIPLAEQDPQVRWSIDYLRDRMRIPESTAEAAEMHNRRLREVNQPDVWPIYNRERAARPSENFRQQMNTLDSTLEESSPYSRGEIPGTVRQRVLHPELSELREMNQELRRTAGLPERMPDLGALEDEIRAVTTLSPLENFRRAAVGRQQGALIPTEVGRAIDRIMYDLPRTTPINPIVQQRIDEIRNR